MFPGDSEVCAFLAAIVCTVCVQEGGFEGPENGPKQRRINNRLLSYRPQHRRGNVHNYLIVRWFSVFRNCAESAGRTPNLWVEKSARRSAFPKLFPATTEFTAPQAWHAALYAPDNSLPEFRKGTPT